MFGKCIEWFQNDLDMFKVKIPICTIYIYIYISMKPKFSSVWLYNKSFLSYAPPFLKVHRIIPMTLTLFKVKNTNMHATYTLESQIFLLFYDTMSCFWVMTPFPEKCTEWHRCCKSMCIGLPGLSLWLSNAPWSTYLRSYITLYNKLYPFDAEWT